ncbi:MAG: NUDIX hydrolase [Acetatifactor sp.]|nr:NUDIX hydrolase [Acetatifactor sp.]
MNEDNTNWGQSVTGVVIRENKVLLARHTYGVGIGKLIIPGGYVNYGETPQDAWYIAFRADYISGVAKSEGDENNEVLWIEIDEALKRDDVPELTKKLIESAISKKEGLLLTEYNGSTNHDPKSLYCINEGSHEV